MSAVFETFQGLTRPWYHNITTPYEPWKNSYFPVLSWMEKWVDDNKEWLFYQFSEGGLWWTVSFPASLIYLITIFTIQGAMKSRPRFELRKPLAAWNFFLSIFSFMIVWRTTGEMFDVMKSGATTEETIYNSICTGRHAMGDTCAWIFFFALSKLVEFGDTVFVVLRKQPLIFLHYFHHVVTMIFCFYTLIDWSSTARYFVVMNASVHTIMYGYFGLKACRVKIPKTVSMCITTTQLAQMVVGTYVNVKVLSYLSQGMYCETTRRHASFSLTMYGIYVLLFGHFFYKAYLDKSRKVAGPKTVPATTSAKRATNIARDATEAGGLMANRSGPEEKKMQ